MSSEEALKQEAKLAEMIKNIRYIDDEPNPAKAKKVADVEPWTDPKNPITFRVLSFLTAHKGQKFLVQDIADAVGAKKGSVSSALSHLDHDPNEPVTRVGTYWVP